MAKVTIFIICLCMGMAVGTVSCGEVKPVLQLGPQPEVVGREAYDTVVEGDYSVVVKVDILNRGRSGDVEVIGELWWQGSYWKQSKVIYLPEGMKKEVHLVFKGPNYLGSVFGFLSGQEGFEYRVYVKAR